MLRPLLAAVILASSLRAQFVEPPEPLALEPAYAHSPLPTTRATVLHYRADARGGLRALVAAPRAPVLTGRWKAGEPGAGLPGFEATLEMDEAIASPSSIEFPDAARVLGPAAFTLDLLVRLSRRDGIILQAGAEAAAGELAFLDRDGGTFRLSMPVVAADGKIRMRTLEVAGALERAGPVRTGEFQRLTVQSDGGGGFRGWLDGIECFAGTLPQAGEKLAAPTGSLRLGAAVKANAAFGLDFAEIRVQPGGTAPSKPAVLARTPGQNGAGWRFDFGRTESPVEPGWIGLTPTDAYTKGKSWGLLAVGKGTFDQWFVGDRWWSTPEQVTSTKTRRARAWPLRDGIEFDSGKILRVDVPAGRYAVSVTFGHLTKSLKVERIEVNGRRIGEVPGQKLRTVHSYYPRNTNRTARGLIDVAAGQPLEIAVIGEEEKGRCLEVAVLAVEIVPIAPLPAMPAGVAAGSDDAAWRATEKIPDVVARATRRAAIIGRPEVTTAQTLERVRLVRAELWSHLQRRPDDRAARYLFEQTEYARQAMLSYLYQPANGVLFGARKGRNWHEGIDQALRILPGEVYFGHVRLLAGNLLWQSGQQGGGYVDEMRWRRTDRPFNYAPPVAIFREIVAAFPDSGLARMFLGEKVPVAKQIVVPPGTPEWAALEHRAMVRILDVLDYWRTERTEEDGTMGGGLGDDVEMLRWWNMGVLVADDAGAREGWRKLAETAWESMGRQAMIAGPMSDAEHIAEDFADSHALLPIVNFATGGYDEAMRRARSLHGIITRHLLRRNPDGYLMFKSHVYSANEVDKRDGDAPYNIRTIFPLIHYAFLRPDDQEIAALIADYARSWRDMTMREIDGKPAGITPMMIRFDRSSVVLPGSAGARLKQGLDWVFPGYWNYEYPGGFTNHIYDLLIAAYHLTGDATMLEPHRRAAEFLRTLKRTTPRCAEPREVAVGGLSTHPAAAAAPGAPVPTRGSLAWAIDVNRDGLATAVEKYRQATGDHGFDDVLRLHGSPYVQFQIALDESTDAASRRRAVEPIVRSLRVLMPELDFNEAFRTNLVFNTDRIWVQGSQFINTLATGLVSGEPPFSTRGAEINWPTFGVTWEKTGRDYSMLVGVNQTTRFEAFLYGMPAGTRLIAGRFWQLAPGDYEVVLCPAPDFAGDGQPPVFSRPFKVETKGQRFEFEVPGQRQLQLIVRRLR
jgi:hypothetical protein